MIYIKSLRLKTINLLHQPCVSKTWSDLIDSDQTTYKLSSNSIVNPDRCTEKHDIIFF